MGGRPRLDKFDFALIARSEVTRTPNLMRCNRGRGTWHAAVSRAIAPRKFGSFCPARGPKATR